MRRRNEEERLRREEESEEGWRRHRDEERWMREEVLRREKTGAIATSTKNSGRGKTNVNERPKEARNESVQEDRKVSTQVQHQ